MTEKVKKRLDNVKLHGWQVLDLRNCGLKEFPLEIFEYPDIRTIDLSNDSFCDDNMRNNIKIIPNEISKLKNLIKLNLSYNKINTIPENITSLRKLKYLNLSNNNLTHLSEKIANMSNLQILNLENNPFDFLPPEIVARGIESIRNFIKELSVKDFLFEVKLILVGEGRVGKTCIANALIHDNYQLDGMESTEGINIDRWIIPQNEISEINSHITRDFQINIWDFGGQEIYHSTHQFFLTKRSIYLLVTESRKEDRYDDFYYWLNVIKLLGDKSPVIMVLNKCDQPTKELPIKDFKDIFSNIVDFVKVSLKDDYKDTFNSFKLKLKKLASNLPHIGNPLPKVWVDIRREIENLKLEGKNYISEEEYLEICKKHYRSEESALFLSEYFHDLGVILHFKDDIELKDIVFLNHEWITKGVYSILDDRKIITQKGKFDSEDLKRIWKSGDYKFKMRELLALMKNKKFDLCFEMKTGEYLVPRLLPVDEIEHTWITSPSNLKFELRYKFMPKGILARLIVKLCNDIFEDKYWRYGVILKYESTKAIIKEKYFENKITIEISGNYKREYLFNIRKAINEIHKDFNRIEVSEMIPCNCSHCSCVENPSFHKFELLKRYELNEIKFIRCSLSLEEVNVLELTRDVISGQLSKDKLVFCENKNADILKGIGLENAIFFPERDSASVFIQVKTTLDRFGLRDRDFLTDSEISKIKSKYPNYYILNYYCFENYLFHPDNIEELKLQDFDKNKYIKEIIRQKNENKNQIISNYKMSRKSYQEFKIESENLKIKEDESEIIYYLESDELEIFFKSYSMKDYFNKNIISKYNLQPQELSKTKWFKNKMIKILDLNK